MAFCVTSSQKRGDNWQYWTPMGKRTYYLFIDYIDEVDHWLTLDNEIKAYCTGGGRKQETATGGGNSERIYLNQNHRDACNQ